MNRREINFRDLDDGIDCDDDICYALKTYYVSGMVLNTYGHYLT